MNGYELKMLRFLVSQCRKCKGTGNPRNSFKQCLDCQELRELIARHTILK